MKALDIVKTPLGGIGWITETNSSGTEASVKFFNTCNVAEEKSAWWNENELLIIDSIPRTIAMATAHPFGNGRKDVELFFNE